ncbi:MAG: class I adenylate-forming enzyme family protein, partial [Deferribacterota bacterium]|nr:class I adenylate-forming enzyme family protein [Deferribacterota bacterium]
MDVFDLLVSAEERYDGRTAIIDGDKEISYAEMKENAFKLANALHGLGLEKGDKVAVYIPNRAEYFYIYYACYITGIIIVPIDFYLKEDEVINIVDHCGVKLIFAENNQRCNLTNLKNKSNCLKNIISLDSEPQYLSYNNLTNNMPVAFKKVDIERNHYSSIFCTSGSTGKPKGVLWNYRHIHIGSDALDYFLHDYIVNARAITAIPLSHSGGMLFPMLAIKCGLSTVMLERFHPLVFLKLVEKWRVSMFWMVPPMWYALLYLKEIERFDLTSVKLADVFGAPSDPETLRRAKKYFPNADLFNGWGMTEVVPPVTVCEPNNITTVGKPHPWVTLQIADENGLEKNAGEIGELRARGEGVFMGYYNEPELTAKVFDDGWFKTGDLAKKDKNGNYYIVGRTKDMLKVGGQIVWCNEIENI